MQRRGFLQRCIGFLAALVTVRAKAKTVLPKPKLPQKGQVWLLPELKDALGYVTIQEDILILHDKHPGHCGLPYWEVLVLHPLTRHPSQWSFLSEYDHILPGIQGDWTYLGDMKEFIGRIDRQ